MSTLKEVDNEEIIEFEWKKKRGIGKKGVQFYESFKYDGVEYALFDSIYLYEEGELEPYIGKLIKIWEFPDKTKKVKILWFFRPSEISNWFDNEDTLDNELFLASGEGVGLTNINSLEAIAGKCNVICTSKDSRNSQYSPEELRKADFIFYRTFDVGHCKILDKIDEKIAGVEVKFIFNRIECHEHSNIQRHDPDTIEKRLLSTQNISEEFQSDNRDNCTNVVEKETVDVRASCAAEFSELIDAHDKNDQVAVDMTVLGFKLNSEKIEGKVNQILDYQESNVEVVKPTEDSSLLEHAVVDKTALTSKVNSVNIGGKANKILYHQDTVEVKAQSIKDSSICNGGSNEFVGKDVDVKALCRGESDGIVVSGVKEEHASVDKTTSSPKLDSVKFYGKVNKITNNQSLVEEKAKSSSDSGLLDDGSLNKANVHTSIKSSQANMDGLQKFDSNVKSVMGASPIGTSSLDNRKSKRAMDSPEPENSLSKRLKPDDSLPKNFNGNSLKASRSVREDNMKKYGQLIEVTRRLEADRSVWFKGLDIVFHGFKESCQAMIIQHTAFSSPHSGQAFVIFKTCEVAHMVVRELKQGCLMLSNGRALVGSIGNPCFTEKCSLFTGHFSLDKSKLLMQREEMKQAVSTSHCAQPNTIAYEMAMDWSLLLTRSESWWNKMYKKQGLELKRLMDKLESK